MNIARESLTTLRFLPHLNGIGSTQRGVGRSSSPAAERLSESLRHDRDPLLNNRRRVAGLALGAIGSLSVVALYQMGIIPSVPEPPIPGLDANKVDSSGEAYNMFKTPDAALGIASYALTLILAGAGDADRADRHPWIVLAFAGKIVADAISAGFLTAEQVTRHRRLCSWCLLSAGLSFAMLPAAVPETRRALSGLFSR